MSAENNNQKLTRREFLRVSVVAGAGAVLAACGMPEPTNTPDPTYKLPDTNTPEPTKVPPDTPEQPTSTPEIKLDDNYIRVLNSLKNEQEWDRFNAGEEVQETEIYQKVNDNPDSDESKRLLKLIDVMTCTGDVIDFNGRGVVEFWPHDPRYSPESPVNSGQYVIKVNGGVEDEYTGKTYLWNWVGEGAEADPDLVLEESPSRAVELGLLVYTPNEGEEIVKTITREEDNGKIVSEYISVASVNEEGKRSKWTDISGTKWIDPVTNPEIVLLDDDGESNFYRIQVIQENGDGQNTAEDAMYYGGDSLPAIPREGLLLYEDKEESGQVNPVLVRVDEQGERQVRYKLAVDPETGNVNWVEQERKWTGRPEFEFSDKELNSGLMLNPNKVDELWENMLRAIAAGELFRVVEGGRGLRGGDINMDIVNAEYQRLQSDPYKWVPSEGFLAEVDKYNDVINAELDANEGMLEGVAIPWLDGVNHQAGFTYEDVIFKSVKINFERNNEMYTVYAPLKQGEQFPNGGSRLNVSEDNELVIELLRPKKGSPNEYSYMISYGIEGLVTGYSDLGAFLRINKTKNSIRETGEDIGRGIVSVPDLYHKSGVGGIVISDPSKN